MRENPLGLPSMCISFLFYFSCLFRVIFLVFQNYILVILIVAAKPTCFFAVTTMNSKCAVLLQKAMPEISEIRRGQVVETWYQ